MGRLTVLTAVLAVLVAGLGACEKSTVSAKGKKLTLSKPADQTIRRGETNEVKISISRDGFRDPVTIKFEDLPAGVHLQDQTRQILSDDSSTTFTLRADPDTALTQDHVVRVTASAPDGLSTSEAFKLSVKDKG